MYIMKYYWALRKKNDLPFAATRIDEHFMLSEISETEKQQAQYKITYMCNLNKPNLQKWRVKRWSPGDRTDASEEYKLVMSGK